MLSEINEATAVVSLGLSFSTHKLEEIKPLIHSYRLLYFSDCLFAKIQDLCAALSKLT